MSYEALAARGSTKQAAADVPLAAPKANSETDNRVVFLLGGAVLAAVFYVRRKRAAELPAETLRTGGGGEGAASRPPADNPRLFPSFSAPPMSKADGPKFIPDEPFTVRTGEPMPVWVTKEQLEEDQRYLLPPATERYLDRNGL